jgi:hypothetical protein
MFEYMTKNMSSWFCRKFKLVARQKYNLYLETDKNQGLKTSRPESETHPYTVDTSEATVH